jgi:hypothetical protein
LEPFLSYQPLVRIQPVPSGVRHETTPKFLSSGGSNEVQWRGKHHVPVTLVRQVGRRTGGAPLTRHRIA